MGLFIITTVASDATQTGMSEGHESYVAVFFSNGKAFAKACFRESGLMFEAFDETVHTDIFCGAEFFSQSQKHVDALERKRQGKKVVVLTPGKATGTTDTHGQQQTWRGVGYRQQTGDMFPSFA